MASISDTRHQLKAIYWHAQGGRCAICGMKMRGWESPKTTFEHVWPLVANAESGQLGNVMLSHHACNQKKGRDKPTTENLASLAEINRKLSLPEGLVGHWEKV